MASSWTNDVVEQMRGDGFTRAEHNRQRIDEASKTGAAIGTTRPCLIVDEAAMISTENLASADRGRARAPARNLFWPATTRSFPASSAAACSRLCGRRTARRSSKTCSASATPNRKQRFRQDARRRVSRRAQDLRQDGRHSLDGEAARRLACTWWTSTAPIVCESPEKTRFMFAFSNAEVDALNVFAREMHKQRGELGEDHRACRPRGARPFSPRATASN